MKPGEQHHLDILQAYETWLHAYINGDVKTYDSYFDDGYRFIGSTNNEEFLNREETTAFFTKTADQLAGKTDLRNHARTVEERGGQIFITHFFDAYFLNGSEWTYYGRFRFSSVMQEKGDGWKFIYQHFSMPDSKSEEGDTIGYDRVAEENQELREAIKRRTIELESKNRELEIEAALEKVRTVALAMKEPADMLGVCHTIAVQLKKLGVNEIRNVQTAIFYESKGTYMNYEFYAKHNKEIITETSYTNHKVHLDFANQMLKGKGETYKTHIDKRALNDWIAYQKTTNVFIDTFLEAAPSLTYYWHSLGPVALGISTYVQLSGDELDLFKHFLNVFELAYTRYLDIEQAMGQAREAQIELALERVRARTMAMQKSGELAEVSSLLFQQVKALGVNTYSSGFSIWDNYDKDLVSWMCNADGSMNPSFIMPVAGDPWHITQYESWKKGEDFIVKDLIGEEMQSYFRYLRSFPLLDEAFGKSIAAGHPMPERQVHHVANFSQGNLLFITLEPCPEADGVFKRFAKVFDQTYTRFLDLQKAEEQAKEARIEAALEKVRSRSLAMHRSEELQEVVTTVFERLKDLDIETDAINLDVFSENIKDAYLWTAVPGHSYSREFHIPYNETLVFQDIYKGMVAGKELHSKVYSREEKDEFLTYIFTQTDFRHIPEERKAMLFATEASTVSVAYAKHIAIVAQRYREKAFSGEENQVLKRFAKVFEQAYTRFLDLKKAEAQAREAKMEASLERVRAAAMSMHRSEQLINVCEAMFKELITLGFSNIRNAQISIRNINDGTYFVSEYSDHVRIGIKEAPIDTSPLLKSIYDEMERSKDAFYQREITGKEFKDWRKWRISASEEHDPRIFDATSMWFYLYSLGTGYIGISTFGAITIEQNHIVKRFRNVFELAYRRYTDVAQAEAQAKEARIEAALEKVRSRSLAMQKSEELKDVIQVVYEQFVHLNVNTEHTGFVIDYKQRDDRLIWVASKHGVPSQLTIPYFDSVYYNSFNEAKEKGWDFFATNLSFEEKNSFYRQLFTYIPDLPEEAKEFYFTCPGLAISTVLLENVGLYIENFEGIPYSDADNAILMRFGKVFQQTYTRFLDLQKAEAQAREAQIEAALERVRSRTMGMQQSHELGDVATILFKELNLLVDNLWSCGFVLCEKDRGEDEWWLSTGDGFIPAFYLPNTGDATHAHIYDAWKKGDTYYTEQLESEALQEHYDWLMSMPVSKKIFDDMKAAGNALPAWQKLHCAYFSYGYLVMITKVPCPEEQIFKRFAQVFDQTYTRFLDLQKAEAQAREAQTVAALEKVRSRSLAMHTSTELGSVVSVLLSNLHDLGFVVDNGAAAHLIIFSKDSRDFVQWSADPFLTSPVRSRIPYTDSPLLSDLFNARENRVNFFTKVYSFGEKNAFFTYAFEYSDLKHIPEELKQLILKSNTYTHWLAIEENSAISVNSFTGNQLSENQIDILKRFGKVFEQSYIRFLDLQKAEAQAREAKIEGSLERIRAKAMAMHRSEELDEVLEVLFDQFDVLGIVPMSTHLTLIDLETNTFTFRETGKGGRKSFGEQTVAIDSMDIWTDAAEKWRTMEPLSLNKLHFPKESLPVVWQVFHDSFASMPEGAKIVPEDYPDGIYHTAGNCKFGYLGMNQVRKATEEEEQIVLKFSVEFGRLYQRFLDLQKAEAQSRESQIEAALERVRSRTMSMQKSDELAETAAVLFRQLINLGIAPNRLYISIISDDSGNNEFWVTDEDGSKVSKQFMGSIHRNNTIKKMYEGWKAKKKSFTIDMDGKELADYLQYLAEELKVPFKDGLSHKRRVQTIAYFSKGFIGIASPEPQPEETLSLLERFASVFNLTFTRFNDLKIAEAHAEQAEQDLFKLKEEKKRTEEALAELQVTQKQLIQSEKMASLGELTAGIAHEIQNPLNFVNNFSEVSTELLDEMLEEVAKGNYNEVKAIVDDVKQNLEKINHHGKRADGIVKGMLQHSRSSSGQKEPTDINVLADEYLRLAYHGLRAKDKTFNATMKTEYDKSLEKIHVIPQDIGRVVLNLITNAFYVVNEKKKSGSKDYEPTVSVITKKIRDKVEISVRDNGSGIPQKLLDKIFQPFFTTKPTGQGTGLGLSLSYDIVKAHGGELKVQTKEGQGSEFSIQLPIG